MVPGRYPMLEQTGSVYLDAPRPAHDYVAPRTYQALRRALAGSLILIGLMALTSASFLGGVRLTLRNPSTVTDAVDTSLDEPLVQDEIEREIADAIESSLIGEDVADLTLPFGIYIKAEALRIAPLVITDPAFRTELTALITEAHERILLERSDEPLDFAPITAAVVALIERESPDLARVVPTDTMLLTIDGHRLPDLTTPMAGLDRALRVAFLAALALPFAALIHPCRHRVLAWLGRWLLAMALISGLSAVGLPHLAGNLSGYSAVEVAVRALTVRLLGPAVVAGIIGTAAMSAAAVLKSRERRRVAEEGAAAALGANEPPLMASTASPQLDLSSRGLVDAKHPLTNI